MLVKRLERYPDERGYFGEIMRTDWKDLLGEDLPVQANLSFSYPGIVRAWHRHGRGQSDYFLALRGALRVCAYDESSGELDEVVSSGELPQIVKVPGHYWHGFKAVGNDSATLLYFVNKLYDHDNPDEERRPWNDRIVPRSINGKSTGPRVGRPWDWSESPNK